MGPGRLGACRDSGQLCVRFDPGRLRGSWLPPRACWGCRTGEVTHGVVHFRLDMHGTYQIDVSKGFALPSLFCPQSVCFPPSESPSLTPGALCCFAEPCWATSSEEVTSSSSSASLPQPPQFIHRATTLRPLWDLCIPAS